MGKGASLLLKRHLFSDDPDDEGMKTLKGKLEALVSCAEHHLAGVKVAKTRFSNL